MFLRSLLRVEEGVLVRRASEDEYHHPWESSSCVRRRRVYRMGMYAYHEYQGAQGLLGDLLRTGGIPRCTIAASQPPNELGGLGVFQEFPRSSRTFWGPVKNRRNTPAYPPGLPLIRFGAVLRIPSHPMKWYPMASIGVFQKLPRVFLEDLVRPAGPN